MDEIFCQKQSRPADSVPCVVDVCPVGWESRAEVKRKIDLDYVPDFRFGRESTVFTQQGRVLVRSGLLSDTKKDPVYVWSPTISKCSKSCGNGE